MQQSLITIAYIAASALFILSLGGLSQQETARRGNVYGIVGMLIALVATECRSLRVSKGLTPNLNGISIMLDDYGFEVYEENPFPMAYLLTFRTYGTWLHGDSRTSVRRNGNNRFGGPKVTPSVPLHEFMQDRRRQAALVLDEQQRKCVEAAIKEVCEFRNYLLRALNVRTNHGHVVVSAAVKPEKIVNDLKAYATRRLRAECLCDSEQKVWSRGASTRYLWKPRHVEGAVDYVKYCQEDIPFEFRD